MGIKKITRSYLDPSPSGRARVWRLLFSLLAFGFFSSSVVSQDDPLKKSKETAVIDGKKYYKHTVQKGETIYAIAKAYSMEVKDIVFENPNAIDGVKPGQVLKIPFGKQKTKKETSAKEVSSDTAQYILHKVEQGQTLYSISRQYKVSMEVIASLNPEIKDGLKAGKMLKIPMGADQAHKVKANEGATNKGSVPVDSIGRDEGVKKKEYNVALLLPFNLEQAESIDIEAIRKGNMKFPARSEIAVEFFQGALMAIDSLKNAGFSCKLFVYDVEEGDSVQKGILKKPELKEMHLIIGPLFGSNFTTVARFAKENKIPIVSPYLQQNKILYNNPFVSKVTPSNNTQLEQLAVFVADTFRKENLIAVFSGNGKEAGLVKTFKNSVNNSLKAISPADSIREVGSFDQMESKLSETKVNVVCLISNNQRFITEFINKLYTKRDKYKIVLVGMQNWITYDNLDIEYLNSLQLHLPAANFIDYDGVDAKKFIRRYRQKYATEPGTYVFQGYDVVYYYLKSLQNFGTGFQNKLSSRPYQGIQISCLMYRPSSDSGFENRSVFILKYKDYKLVKAN